MYLGAWYIGDYLTFTCVTHNPTTGEVADADSAPSYRIYKDEVGTAILTGTMTKLDDGNTTGFYSERIQLTEVSNFNKGSVYTIYIEATVNGYTGACCLVFNIKSNAEHNIRKAGERIVVGAVEVAGFTPTTTQFESSDITEASTDHFKYRLVMFTSGNLQNQVRDITAYELHNGRGKFTCTAFTEAPVDGDEFVII